MFIRALLFSLALSLGIPGHATLLSIAPAAGSVQQGQPFELAINIDDVTDLYGFQFDVHFSGGRVAVVRVEEGEFLISGGGFVPGLIDNGGGSVSFIANTLLGPQAGVDGSGTLAHIWMQAVAPGFTTLELSNVLLLDSALQLIATDTAGANLLITQVQAVDVPPALPLMILGLLLMRLRAHCGAGRLR